MFKIIPFRSLKNKSIDINKLDTNGLGMIAPEEKIEFTLIEHKVTNSNDSVLRPQILFITSYPPRECGIATYSHDLIMALNNKYSRSFSIKVCALESGLPKFEYPKEVLYVLNTLNSEEYSLLSERINNNIDIGIILFQHEFGLYSKMDSRFIQFLHELKKPIIIAFHTVLSSPNKIMYENVRSIIAISESLIVMTNNAAKILKEVYSAPDDKIIIIPHGTHLVPHLNRLQLKEKYHFNDCLILSTFGLLSSGKSIETTLDALPSIIKQKSNILFLVIGKTHPDVVKSEDEQYRNFLENKVKELNLENHVLFINAYLPLNTILEYLQLTDIYLFTSKNPGQAVSGTFAYAMGCGCAIISTPIPHVREVLSNGTGVIIDFEDSKYLSDCVLHLLNNDSLRDNIRTNALHKIVSTAWENSAIAHANLFEKIIHNTIILKYNLPEIKLDHLRRLTTDFGIIQFSKINQPDIDSGYTLDDNARALIAACMHYESKRDEADLLLIQTYVNFIIYCQQEDGRFLNYVDKYKKFTSQNYATNLEDSNGRIIWALGYLISLEGLIPLNIRLDVQSIMQRCIPIIENIKSPRAIAFAIKGLFYYDMKINTVANSILIKVLGEKLVEWYKENSDNNWQWFESYLTYANSILPEAMLYVYIYTRTSIHKDIAIATFNFLLSRTFQKNSIKIISNKSWLHKEGKSSHLFGEQPIDVSYTIMTLAVFYEILKKDEYLLKMEIAFSWFLGNNHLHQIIYNPCTGGCYDGLEESHVNLNQGAESTVCYLMARMIMEKNFTNL